MTGTIVVERDTRILAPAVVLVPYLAELPRWVEWSPWEGLDSDMRREYTGEPGAVGSTYTWEGNRKAGAGRMRIDAVRPDGVDIDLEFTRPFRSRNALHFVLVPEDGGTRVLWRMEAPRTLWSRIFNMEKLVGPDFERGLKQLRQVAEAEVS
jgi:hypothetical protein